MRNYTIAAALTAAVAAVPAFAQNQPQRVPMDPPAQQMRDGMNQGADSMKSGMDDMKNGMKSGMDDAMSKMSPEQAKAAAKRYVEHAGQTNAYEYQSAQRALQKSSDPQVKKIAQRIVSDHEQAMGDLKQAAKSGGYDVPSEPSEAQRALMQRMDSLDGTAFDKAYVFDMAGYHAADLLKDVDAQNHLQDQSLKQYAAKTVKEQAQHKSEVMQVAHRLAGGDGETGRMGATGGMGMSDGAGYGGDAARPAGATIGDRAGGAATDRSAGQPTTPNVGRMNDNAGRMNGQ